MLRGVARAVTAPQRRAFTSSRRSLARVLISDNVQRECGDIFAKHGHTVDYKHGLSKQQLMEIIPEYEALVVRSATKVTEDVVKAAFKLKIIGRAGTGVDNIDVSAATKHGILVVNTPGGNTQSTAELAISHILSLARNIPQATAALKAGKWDRKTFVGKELTGKTLGVIGVGRIGREVAKSCKAFGMNVVGYDPLLAESSSRSAGIEPVPLNDLFSKADFITFHTPLTADTRHLLNAETLRKCKSGVRIINCARGGIVDEDALLEALKSGHVAGAALDVLEQEPPAESRRELLNHPRVVVTPHLGASTSDAQERVARNVAVQMCDILAGGDYVGVVNAPNMTVARKFNLVPHVLLAERIGSLQAQLLGAAKVRNITVNLRGKKIAIPEITEAVKAAVLKGALSSLTVEPVNYVNASAHAEDLGMSVSVNLSSTTDTESGFSDSIAVSFEIEGMLNANRTIQGTVYGENELRINSIDGFDIDLQPANDMLLFNNRDEPGVLRQVSKILAQADINIAHFSLGRKAEGRAMGAVVLDSPCPLPVLEQLRNLRGILSNVHAVHIEENIDPVFRIGSSSSNGVGGDGTQVAGGSNKPTVRPRHPEFSSGPCKKRPGYDLAKLRTDVLGRSHRSKLGKTRLKRAIEETKRILNVPQDYLVGIVPGSDTGAFEMAMWAMLGERPVDVLYWESFGKGWFQDAKTHLKLDVHEHVADYGHLPDLSKANMDHDILFAWNGTTSGVCVPNADWIASDRSGLTFNDATSAAFAMDIAWDKVDVTTFSWQKVLGGEGAHGVLILSPRAVERLETYVPPNRPLPKIFRLTSKNKLNRDIFEGSTINTPSMLCIEDYLDALEWADSVGGLPALMKRARDNFGVIEKFVKENDWIHFLAADPAVRSCTSVCLTLDLDKDQVKRFVQLLDTERVAYDIGAYRDAPSGLRIWCGATVEKEDLEALMPWLTWAYETVKQ